MHFGTEDKEAIAAVREFAEGLAPDISVICGDITQSGKIKEFEAAQEWIRTLPGPKVITPGNHDTPMFGLFHRAFSPFGRYYDIIHPLSEEFYADKNIIIVPLNTARGMQMKLDWSLGVADLPIINKKIKQLHSAEPGALKMIACHHPMVYPEISPLRKETKNGRTAIKHLSDNDIDAVLSGHVHTPFFVDREPGETGILSIGSGTLSTRSRGKPASFNHIHISDTQISITAIDWINGKFGASKP